MNEEKINEGEGKGLPHRISTNKCRMRKIENYHLANNPAATVSGKNQQ